MDYRFLIHDLSEEDAWEVFRNLPPDVIVFAAKPKVNHCVGCYGCWVKTPGKCVIPDRCAGTPEIMAKSRELILVSRNVYGGFSPEVKTVLDRSIGYALPFFQIIHNEMHHTSRYDNSFLLTARFYGGVGETERGIAKALVKANCVNFGADGYQVFFHDSLEELKEAAR